MHLNDDDGITACASAENEDEHQETKETFGHGTEEFLLGWSNRLPSKAAASKEARRTELYVEPPSDARTKLEACFTRPS